MKQNGVPAICNTQGEIAVREDGHILFKPHGHGDIHLLMSQHGVLLAVMAGIILSGILAATMSTADSQLLAAASSVSQDLMQHSFGIKMNQRTTMLAARTTVICIAIIGMGVCAVGAAISVLCAALSHLTRKAADMRSENDLTI